jgi:predicted DNA-binding transcriptional regulator AlpA
MSSGKERAARVVPRLLRRERAADYCDVSPPTFLKLVSDGKLPPPRKMNQFEVWDRPTSTVPSTRCPMPERTSQIHLGTIDAAEAAATC